MKESCLAWKYLGQRPYREVWNQQEMLRERILLGQSQGCLLLVEHPPTISVGKGESGENLLWDEETMKKRGFDVVTTNRGGKVTYHGPGQLVAYPVISLRALRMGVKDFVHALEETMIDVCRRFSIQAARKEKFIGAWVGHRKIGSVGIHVKRQVSIHGLALNVCPDLSHFSMITPCGISGVSMTSMQKEGVSCSVETIIEPFLSCFSHVFSCDLSVIQKLVV